MIRDVFYYGNKPNVHPREKFAKNLADARQQSVTEHFWIINEYCDYKNFDWEFDFDYLPDEDVWAQDHNNIWPSTHQKDSGTWLCPKEHSDILIYRADVDPLKRKHLISEHWKIFDNIDTDKWDFTWHPDPTDPPYIYRWGCKFFPVEFKHVLEYYVENATEIKYMENIVELLPSECLKEYIKVDRNKFDISWRPDPRDEPYIYVWGNKYIPGEIQSTIEYHVPNAIDKKYMGIVEVLPEYEKWHEYSKIDKTKFDMSWRPDPREPAYIYVWGNKYVPGELQPTLEYVVEGATEKKYMQEPAPVIPEYDRWKITQTPINFDYTWRPDPREPAYIYVWGNKWISGELLPTIEYIVPGATERKYMGDLDVEPNYECWNIVQLIDNNLFDLTWRPDPREPAYIYIWGNKYIPGELKPTVEYHCLGATEKKYMPELVPVLPDNNWIIYQDIDKNHFDLCWRPDPREPAYIYVWGNKYIPGQLRPTIEYIVPGATEYKYMHDEVIVLPELDKWKITQTPKDFDFTWRPDPREPAYIYVWGNKYVPGELQPTLEYVVEGATEKKYMGNVDVEPEYNKWFVYQNNKFDMSWRPDPREPPYIYVWGNKYIPGELKPTIEYVVPGATERKYMGDVELVPEVDKWTMYIPIDESKFDMCWRPDPREPPYIYVWGNKYIPGELKPTLEYIVQGATERKYMGNVDVLPMYDKYVIHCRISDFDFTWIPDPREPPYIYTWGNEFVPAEIQPTLEFVVDNATERKYMGNVKVLPETDRWIIHQEIDTNDFDLSWRPDPREPPYIYVWGNKYIPGELKPTLEYYCPEATEKKYMGDVKVIPELHKWNIVQQINTSIFDLSWRPDPKEPPYIYVWGNKHIRGELKSTIEYHCENATEYKYMKELVEVLPEYERWKVLQNVSDFDFTWRPDPREPAYIYIWGNKYIPGELQSTIEYHCPGATEKKYMGNADVLPEFNKYNVLVPIDKSSFDFAWRPDPREPPYIYVWGNQSNSAEIEPTIEYYCDNATERKYMSDRFAKTLPNMKNYKVLIPVTDFDFSWRPDPGSPPYIYVFGNQWHDAMTEPTIEYHVENAKDKKYITHIVAKTSVVQQAWRTLIPVESFDYTWRPNPHSPPYIYVFGNQWNDAVREPTIEYHVPNATEYKYVNDIVARVKSTATDRHWKKLIEIESFDYSWRPDPKSPPYIYVFGNKWNKANVEPTIEYYVEGAVDKKYMDNPVAVPSPKLNLWSVSNGEDLDTFDFTWRPNPHSPPQIYQWENDGPRYTVPGATDVVLMVRSNTYKKPVINKYFIKTTLEDLILEHKEEVFWALNKDLNYDKFDFTWRPNEQNFIHVNVFGNQYSKNTHTYFVNGPTYTLGHHEYNYVEDSIVEIQTNLSMFFVDKSNSDSANRFKKLKEKYPNLQKTRYLNSWVDTITRCINKSETKLFYVLSSELDYSDFVFDFYPSPWQEKMVHIFGTQWSHWGNTYLINKETFIEDTKYVKIIEHLSCLNFVKNKKAKATDVLYDIVYINHGNDATMSIDIKEKIKFIVDYDTNYHKTFKNISDVLPSKKEHYVWVISSICDYNGFDFSYICDPFAKDQLHVFPSDKQKFGDTFLMDVNKLRIFLNYTKSLMEYEKINYNMHQHVKRLPPPEFIINNDSLVGIDFNFSFPYAIYKTVDNKNLNITDYEPISLWDIENKNVIITSTGGTSLVVPHEAKSYVKHEIYNYPYIIKSKNIIKSNPLDIVYLSNGEKEADENFNHLQKICHGRKNRIVRINGVKGRVNAYHAAANASYTPWAFTVFAKLKVNENFDWDWQPDRLQVPKHYIFHATNILNELEYGHQALIAYNKKIVLNNNGKGLDFTLDDEHEVVPLNSGIAIFNTDEFSTWRTAFREVIKLKHDPTEENKKRLRIWCNIANGMYEQYCLDGAKHALEYYEEVNGDIAKLKLSYDWPWLQEYFNNKYK